MAVIGKHFSWTIEAGEDLSDRAKLFMPISLDEGKITTDVEKAGGILLVGGKIGEHITIGFSGVLKFRASTVISKGALLTINTKGGFVPAVSTDYVVGRCLEEGVSENAIGTGIFDFATIGTRK